MYEGIINLKMITMMIIATIMMIMTITMLMMMMMVTMRRRGGGGGDYEDYDRQPVKVKRILSRNIGYKKEAISF